MNWFLILGAIISLVSMFFHGVAGQKKYMGNIYQSEMEPLTKSLSLVSWHVFTIFLFITSITLFYTAYNPKLTMAVYPIIGVNLLSSLLFIFLGLGNHKALLKMPGAYLMGATALFSWLGIQ
ncbi:hypothetical protein N9W64_04990 [Gammaproteobacteria bacterium]|nr:hypothetical protein [Gammaproteobacteria bacterium]